MSSAPVLLVTSYLPLVATSFSSSFASGVAVGVAAALLEEQAPSKNAREPEQIALDVSGGKT